MSIKRMLGLSTASAAIAFSAACSSVPQDVTNRDTQQSLHTTQRLSIEQTILSCQKELRHPLTGDVRPECASINAALRLENRDDYNKGYERAKDKTAMLTQGAAITAVAAGALTGAALLAAYRRRANYTRS